MKEPAGQERIFERAEKTGQAGFTLAELLVVIAVIMLLLGILVPVLSRCRGLARQAACQNRLRQWGWVFKMYAADNEGYYPHTDGHDRCGDEEPISEASRIDYYYGWVDVLAPLMNEKPWREHEKWKYPGPDTIFQCPAARLMEGNLYDYNPERNGYFSYAMNSCLELDINCRWWESEADAL